jgi:hypothetical protein
MRHHLTCRFIGAAALVLTTPGEFHVAAARMVDSNMGHIGPAESGRKRL